MLDRTDEEVDDRSPELIDTANDQWDVRVMNHMTDSDATALSKVVAALRRLDGGTYGICSECKRAIAPGRLAALPEADRCADCAADAERH
ncbi:MAG TPA: TraR/DksA C4-type zinc finger protein [Kofleriaceae bacterium]|nr:TraR/DksA C4-type zinc finger protein [Kofleriaceae bacterium]